MCIGRFALSVELGTTSSLCPMTKVKVTQSCPTLCDPHGLHSPWNSPGQNTGEGSRSFLQGIFPTQRSNPDLLYCRQILYQLSHQGSLRVHEALSSRHFLLWCIQQHMNTPSSSPATPITANSSMLSSEWRIIKEREENMQDVFQDGCLSFILSWRLEDTWVVVRD